MPGSGSSFHPEPVALEAAAVCKRSAKNWRTSERRSTRRTEAQLPPRHTALGDPVQSQNGGRFVLSWKLPRPKRAIAYRAQSADKKLVPLTVETFSGAKTAATFFATLGGTICAFEGVGWTKVQASAAFPGRQCCLALRVRKRTMDKTGVAVGLATISVGAGLLFSAEHVRYGPMDFIERYLGFAPDGGDGSMEILVLVAIVAIVVVGALWLAKK